jgi:hypothetical protein
VEGDIGRPQGLYVRGNEHKNAEILILIAEPYTKLSYFLFNL